MKCEHQIKSYDNDNWKDSKKVDGIEVLWQCDDCEQKGSHHFEFNLTIIESYYSKLIPYYFYE